MVELKGILALEGHATHITAAEEGAYLGRSFIIVGRVAIGLLVEHDGGSQGHGHAFHVLGKDAGVGQFEAAEVCPAVHHVAVCIHGLGIVLQDVVVNHAGAVVA